jgi:hypothetical protein
MMTQRDKVNITHDESKHYSDAAIRQEQQGLLANTRNKEGD